MKDKTFNHDVFAETFRVSFIMFVIIMNTYEKVKNPL